IDKLGPAGESVQPLFITVDPEHDTPRQSSSTLHCFTHASSASPAAKSSSKRSLAHTKFITPRTNNRRNPTL
ncbi:MAG: SCO family protein, partial [Pseudolabrys sp.]